MEMQYIACRMVQDEAAFKKIVAEMVAYTKENPFDYDAAIEEAKNNKNAESTDGFLVTKSKKEEDLGMIRPYTQFVTIDGKGSLQLSYVEFTKGIEDCAQLTIVNNQHEELTEELIKYIWNLFFGDEPIHAAQTPPHVFLGVRLKYNYDPWADTENG